MENTKIEWTDHTLNFWMGCQHAPTDNGETHPGCQNCYAEDMMDKRFKKVIWGDKGTRVRTSQQTWNSAKKWHERYQAIVRRPEQWEPPGRPPRVFTNSLADFFEDWDGDILDSNGNPLYFDHDANPLSMTDVRNDAFEVIDETPNLSWQILTKRPQNVRAMWPKWTYRDNVHLYTSVSDQAAADELIPKLLQCRDLVPVLGLSIEPLLDQINLRRIPIGGASTDNEFLDALTGQEFYEFVEGDSDPVFGQRAAIDHVIIGGESGPNARPCNIDDIRSLVRQCQAARVKCFVKQVGANFQAWNDDGLTILQKQTYRQNLNDPKGGDPDEWPEDLRVRELV